MKIIQNKKRIKIDLTEKEADVLTSILFEYHDLSEVYESNNKQEQIFCKKLRAALKMKKGQSFNSGLSD